LAGAFLLPFLDAFCSTGAGAGASFFGDAFLAAGFCLPPLLLALLGAAFLLSLTEPPFLLPFLLPFLGVAALTGSESAASSTIISGATSASSLALRLPPFAFAGALALPLTPPFLLPLAEPFLLALALPFCCCPS